MGSLLNFQQIHLPFTPTPLTGRNHGQRPHGNYCQWYDNIETDCHTNARQQAPTTNIAQVVSLGPSNDVSIPIDAYSEYLQYKAATQHTQTNVAHSEIIVALVSQSSSLGLLTLVPLTICLVTSPFSIIYLVWITMADGYQIKVHGIDQTRPSLNHTLDFVLYISWCLFNLISISKINQLTK